MNTKEVTHLRYLADAIAIRPDKTGRFLKTLIEVITSPYSYQVRPVTDQFVVRITKMQEDLGEHPSRQRVKDIADWYSASEDTLERRTGEILLWGLENHRVRQDSRRSRKTPERAMERAKACYERACRDWENAYGPYAMTRAGDDKAYYWRVIQKLQEEARKRRTDD